MEVEIIFEEPVKLGSAEYPSIKLREPKAGELEKANSQGGFPLITLASLVAKVPRKVIEELPQHEYEKVVNFFDKRQWISPENSLAS